VKLGDTKFSFVPVGKESANVAITQFSVRRYPLDKARYEVMLEVTNTGTTPADVELSLLGDGQLVDLTKLRLREGERVPRFYPNLSGASRTLEAKLVPLPGSADFLPVDNHAFALLPERRRAKVLVVTEGNTYLEAALLLDEYLEVTDVSPSKYPDAIAKGRFDLVVFDRVTPVERPKVHALYFDPRGPGSPVKVEGEIDAPGFDKIDRKHPIVRFTALGDVNIAAAHKLVPEPADKVVGAADGGPIVVAGVRGGLKFVAVGFDVRDSDLPLRTAFPLFLLNVVNWFTDEDANYLSSFRTGDIWRVPVSAGATFVDVKEPSGALVRAPVHEGRAVFMGQTAGFYSVTPDTKAAPGEAAVPTEFAANFLDVDESSIGPIPELTVDGREAGRVEGFHVGVRREIWIYLLIAVAILTAIEWATYHRRLTV
jgi:hypothetical protein